MALTPKQRRFAHEYGVDFNATRAAIRAGYSQRTAGQIGFQLLQKPSVAAEIRRQEVSDLERINVTKDWLTSKLAAAFEAAWADKHYSGIGRLGELLARLGGYIAEPTRSVRLIREIADLSDDELAALVQSAERAQDATSH